MIHPLLAICFWVVLAFVMAMIPSNDNHWRRAYVLMAIGAPMLVWMVLTGHLLYAGIFIIVAASVFRWPLVYLYRWLRRQVGL